MIYEKKKYFNIISPFNRYFESIVYTIIFFSIILIMQRLILASEIHLVIQGIGDNQTILSEAFYKEPKNVKVNNIDKDSCKKYCELPYDINNVTLIFDDDFNSFENMFNGLINLIEIDLSDLDTSKVLSMKSMFKDCESLKKINFGNIITSSVENMESFLHNCKQLTSIDLSKFETSSVINMKSMFSNCETITSIDASSFNTSKVQIMEDLFAYCSHLVLVNVSSFDTSNVQNMKGMFFFCYNLKYLDVKNFKFSSITIMWYMFYYCVSLIYLNLKNTIITNKNSELLLDTFTGILNSKFCIEDLETKTFLINDVVANCSDICFQDNTFVDIENSICICNQDYKFEFLSKCYDKCPNNTYQIYKNRKYICDEIFPDKFYLDNNDNIYKECYRTCKTCNKSGNETNNNCNECIYNYTFLNESLAIPYNCYKICPYYYYFDENNKYNCIESCHLQYNKLIEEKNKCIDECIKDDEYKYEYKNKCFISCPNGTKIYEKENKCLDSCYDNQFEYNNNCYDNCPNGTNKLFQNRNIYMCRSSS